VRTRERVSCSGLRWRELPTSSGDSICRRGGSRISARRRPHSSPQLELLALGAGQPVITFSAIDRDLLGPVPERPLLHEALGDVRDRAALTDQLQRLPPELLRIGRPRLWHCNHPYRDACVASAQDSAISGGIPVGTGGRFKGRDPDVPIATLAAAWVPESSGLHRQGRRAAPASRGRMPASALVWQLADAAELLVAWREARRDERRLLERFAELHDGQRPFANLTG
jgi:hypothetical protein